MAKIIAITNQKGGVGKTTTSVNLSACVAAEGKRVLVVDADPQGNTSSGLGVRVKEKTPTVYEVMAGETEIGQALCKTAVKGLTVLPADIRLAGAEIELANMERRERVIADMLEGVREQFDYIFIDCPPSLGMITLNALCAADGVLIPIQCEYFALEGVSALMGTIQKVQKMNRHLAIEGVVLTMLDARTNLGVQVAQEVRKVFKNKVYQTTSRRKCSPRPFRATCASAKRRATGCRSASMTRAPSARRAISSLPKSFWRENKERQEPSWRRKWDWAGA